MKIKKQSEQNQPLSGGGKPNTRKQENKIKIFHKIVKSSLKTWQQVDLLFLNE